MPLWPAPEPFTTRMIDELASASSDLARGGHSMNSLLELYDILGIRLSIVVRHKDLRILDAVDRRVEE